MYNFCYLICLKKQCTLDFRQNPNTIKSDAI